MIYVNLQIYMLRSPEYVGSEPTERATWLNLLGYCCEQENDGRIPNCREWKDRRWQQTCGVTKEEAETVCDLWHWDGDDLVVAFYPHDKQAEVSAKRQAGAKGGKKSRPTQKQEVTQEPEAQLQAELQAQLQAELERKGKEGKGKEGEREPSAPAQPPVVDFTTERQGTMEDLAKRVNSLRPEWARMPRLTHAEMHALSGAAGALQSLDNDGWALLARYMTARLPEGSPGWQPRSRSKFLESPADVLVHAEQWQRKQPRPSKPKPLREEPEDGLDAAAALEILNS